jgi:hypothetical protein
LADNAGAEKVRSFSLTWTEQVTEDEAIVYVSAVQEALELAWSQMPPAGNLVPFPQIRPFGSWVLQDADPDMDYASFQWYQDQAVDPGTDQLQADRFLELMLDEPWQQDTPHYDLSLLHQPLVDAHGSLVLGLAVRGSAAVLSVHTLRALQDGQQRLSLLHRLAAHYLGQALAVPIPEVRQEAHCRNICAMRPASTLPMLIAYTEQEKSAEIVYCTDCQKEMSQRLIGAHWGNN